MSLLPSAQRAERPEPLQILEDLRKIKAEDNEAVERLDNELHSAHMKQELDLDEEENLYRSSSSSELSELEDSESDASPTSVENEEAQLAIDEPQERSKRRRNAAKTYTEPNSSSDDVGGPQKGLGTAVKNTWALNDSEESEIDSMASYTSEGGSDSTDDESEASDFSQGIQGEETEEEMDNGVDDDVLDEQPDQVQSFPLGRHDNEQGKRNKISKEKFEYMVTHGTLNEVQRSKPWEVIAEECGVTASLEDIAQALKQAGIPHGDRLGPKLRVAPDRAQDAASIPRSSSSQASKSSTRNSGSSIIKLTARDLELVVVAFQCLKDDGTFQVDYGKLAGLAGHKNPASASACWAVVRKKLLSTASPPRLTPRDVEVLGLAFQSLKDGCTIQVDPNRFAELAGFSSASSGNASWLVVKKKLMAGPSLVVHASPAAATPLQSRKRAAHTIFLEDSESEDVTPPVKKRRDNVSASRQTHRSPDSPQRHPQNTFSRGGNNSVAKFIRPTAPFPPVVDLVEPVSHLSPENLRNNINGDSILRSGTIDVDKLAAASKEPTTRKAAIATNGTVAEADAALSSTNDNSSKRVTTSNSVATSDMQKKKNVVWNLQAEHMLLLAIVDVSRHKMDYQAIAEKLGCTGKAVSHHISKLRKEACGRNHPISLVKPQNITRPIAWTNRPKFTEAAAKPDDSNARFGLPKASHTKDALFIKNEIAKLEAKVGEDHELAPWSQEEVSALERGLRRFSGPYWSDILALFGPHGSVSDVLKDRDEAQLENKACRMKISFLKSGVKFPFYLRLVTGGLKKVASTVVVDDGKGETRAGEDHGHAKGGVTVVPDEGTTPTDDGTAREAVVASVAPAASEHAIDVSTTS